MKTFQSLLLLLWSLLLFEAQARTNKQDVNYVAKEPIGRVTSLENFDELVNVDYTPPHSHPVGPPHPAGRVEMQNFKYIASEPIKPHPNLDGSVKIQNFETIGSEPIRSPQSDASEPSGTSRSSQEFEEVVNVYYTPPHTQPGDIKPAHEAPPAPSGPNL